MRITDIYIKNYRAFYGEHHICLDKDGKNLMVYGENGSGKSSLFTALQDFLKSSVGKIEIEENIFVPASQKNTASIKVNIKESPETSKTTTFELKLTDKEIISEDKTLIADANKIKGFFDYRSLLRTHMGHKDKVDLFDMLIGKVEYSFAGSLISNEPGILQNSINEFSTKELGREWFNIYKDTFTKRQDKKQQEATKNYLSTKFNPGLKKLLKDIEQDTNTFMKYFGANVKISLKFDKVEYHGRRKLSGNSINLKIDFFEKSIPKHQLFLNEARLSALAISLYLASIKVNPLTGALKILVLDDLLIGLDMSNRLPLLDILKKHFIDIDKDKQFQVIMTTYDKVWYELVRSYFGTEKWKYTEIYTKSLKDDDFEIPVIFNENGYLERAKHYLTEKDYKASAVYLRTEFERIVKTICDKQKIPVCYHKNQKETTSEDFWTAIESQTDLDPALIHEIKIHRGVVMNPFSHYDLEKPEFEAELKATITAVERLIAIDPKNLKKITIEQLKKEIIELKKEPAELKTKLQEKEDLVRELGRKLKSK
ncbi:MAG: AAA family ATPase [Bacteroidales bacterium]|nr:AAA family ATPase [Bacteroidales bacterium]